jgi:serralysin
MATRLERAIDWGTNLRGSDVTYRFVDKGEKSPSPFGNVVSAGLGAYEKAQFKQAFKLFASFTELRFREVDGPVAALTLTSIKASKNSLGAMGPPGFADYGGYGAFNYRGIGWDDQEPGSGGLEQGGFGFVTIIHELGHGLGLAHPHDNGGSSSVFPGVGSSGDLGRFELNQGVYTMMSYRDGWATNPDGVPPGYDYGYEGTPMAVDIAVLQDKYGVNETYHKGADTYRLPDANESGTFYACIWDAGGRDAIVSESSAPATIDLRAATLKPKPGGGGYLSHVDGIFGGFTIAHDVTIENGRGGAGDDIIVGNSALNKLIGGDGDDVIQGRGADDRLIGGIGADRLGGGQGSDELRGGPGDDVLFGGLGPDELYGGPGAPILTGGPGSDRFVFDVSPFGGSIGTITDFATNRDAIVLSSQAFVGVGPEGTLAARSFALGAVATDADHRILYDPVTGAVRFDADGSGSSVATEFARLGPGLALSHGDFVIAA